MEVIVLIAGLSTPNILAIIAIVLVILVPAVRYLPKRRRRIKALYEVIWKKSTRLKPSEIMGNRAVLKDGFHKYYQNREEDIRLEDLLKEGKNTILIGNPLAGKSRTIYQAMKDADKPYSVLIPKVTDIISVDFRKPIYWKFWRKKILILDDLNKFVERQNFSYFLNEFTQQNTGDIIILATCRTEPEYEKLKPEILGIFKEKITFKRFPDHQAEYVAKKTGRKLPDRYDGNIGSIFVDINAMRERFKSASKEETAILRATRRLYKAGIYSGKQLFKYDRIKTVSENIFGLKLEKYQFDEIIDKLIRKGFVLRRKEFIWVEETYLDRVIEDELDILANLKEMKAIFFEDPDALFRIGHRANELSMFDIDLATYKKIAISAFNMVLKFWTVDRSKEDYAMTQNNLGSVYASLAEFEERAENCRLAIRSHNEALKVRSLKRSPIQYAKVQGNLSTAYLILAESSESNDQAQNCRLATRACNEALKVFTVGSPIYYAMAHNNLGIAYQALAEIEDKAKNCKLAIEAYNEASKVGNVELPSIQYGKILNNLGFAYKTLAEVEDTAKNCKLAIKACNEALKIRTLERFPVFYGFTQTNLSAIYGTLAEIEDKILNCELAIKACKEALKVRPLDRFPIQYADSHSNMALTYWLLAGEKDKKENCHKARVAFQEALKGYQKENLQNKIEKVNTSLQALEKFCESD